MSGNEKRAKSPAAVRESGRFAYGGLERVIHERARLSILSSLSAHPNGLLFNDLKLLCDLTDGNLSRQLQALQAAELVEMWKGLKNRRPQTLCRLTSLGRTRFLEYIGELERVVQNALAGEKTTGRSAAGAASIHSAMRPSIRPLRPDTASS